MGIIKTSISDAVKDVSDRVWFFYAHIQYMCYIKQETGHVRFVKKCPYNLADFRPLALFLVENTIYVVSYGFPQIFSFDIEAFEYTGYYTMYNQGDAFYYPFLYKDEIRFLSRNKMNDPVSFSLKGKGISDWEIDGIDNNEYLFSKPILDGDKLLVPERRSGRVLEINLAKNSLKERLFCPQCKPMYLCSINNDLYFTTNWSDAIYRFSNSRVVKECEETNCIKEPFSGVFACGDYIVAMPRRLGKVIIWNTREKKKDEILLPIQNEEIVSKNASHIFGFYEYDGCLYCLPWYIPKLLIINIKEKCVFTRELFYFESDCLSFNRTVVEETQSGDLRNMISLVQSGIF